MQSGIWHLRAGAYYKPRSRERTMSKEEPKKSDDTGWDDRKLCSDGNCIGVIGPDCMCKVCGKPESAEPEAFQEDSLLLDEEEDMPDEVQDGEDGDDDWDSRLLCVDENCIGVIGPGGCCNECGKPHKE